MNNNLNIEHNDNNYYYLKDRDSLKEFIFLTRSGYRHFFVLGKDLKDAEINFLKIDEIKRNGFTLDELPIRLEYDEEKCKEWSMDDFWLYNENRN